ncbi:hypothetical protein [Alicyclobacillus suci]|uniref:hypothetical protein n=1 Tax=Alicyclobacillus suci TaxID=2816080 RepID=UPI001A8D66B8|nr:hypothetical protein [Alicyclobacillus suci]
MVNMPANTMKKYLTHLVRLNDLDWYASRRPHDGANNCYVWAIKDGDIVHQSHNLGVWGNRDAMIKYALLHTPNVIVPDDLSALYEQALAERQKQEKEYAEYLEIHSIEKLNIGSNCVLRVAPWVVEGTTEVSGIDDLAEHIDVIFEGENVGTLESFVTEGMSEEQVRELESGQTVDAWLQELYATFCAKVSVPELAGVREVAEMTGWLPAKVSTYYKRGKLPDPVQVLASGPIWTKQQIKDWIKSENRHP